MRSTILRFFPRSLWLQTITLLAVSIALSAAIAGPYYSTRANTQAADDLDRRGRATVANLEKHADLRLAISLSDAQQAAPILQNIVASDEDVQYVAVLGPNKAPIAAAPVTMLGDALQKAAALHFAPGSSDEVKR